MDRFIDNSGIFYIDTQYEYRPPTVEIPINRQENSSIGKIAARILADAKSLSVAAALTSLISYSDFYLSGKIERIASKTLGICLGNFIGPSTKSFLNKIVSPWVSTHSKIADLFQNSLAGSIIVPALLEEVEFRWFFQGVLLKALPAKILKTLSPGMESWVDSVPAKVTRIAAVSLFFAYLHVNSLECKMGGGISHLIGGALYGTIYETVDSSLSHCINLHILYNIFAEYA